MKLPLQKIKRMPHPSPPPPTQPPPPNLTDYFFQFRNIITFLVVVAPFPLILSIAPVPLRLSATRWGNGEYFRILPRAARTSSLLFVNFRLLQDILHAPLEAHAMTSSLLFFNFQLLQDILHSWPDAHGSSMFFILVWGARHSEWFPARCVQC